MNAITVLTRGYGNLQGYKTLLTRNEAIYKHINKDLRYPLIIFHEGSIPKAHQQHIIDHSYGQDIRFIDISPVWVGGYESMCRFHAYHIWNYCKEFDYILRIDEDCHLINCPVNPFEQVGENVYLRSKYWDESHSETNATLPGRIEQLTGVSRDVFYNRKYPYTNVSLSSVSFWLQPEINKVLKEISLSDEQIKNRWGDLPILGSLLNIYAQGKVGVMEGMSYSHLSHGNVIIAE